MKAVLLLLALIVLPCSAQKTNLPVTIRYVNGSEYKPWEVHLPVGGIFCVTNTTTSRFGLFLTAYEVDFGSNWVTRPLVSVQPLTFVPTITDYRQSVFLATNSVMYFGVAPPVGVVSGTPWRAKLNLVTYETGREDLLLGIKSEPRLLRHRFRTGDTNAPINPFNTKVNIPTKTISIVTPVVPD